MSQVAILLRLWVKDIDELINLLESGSEVAIKWFEENDMVANPGKFQAIIIKEKNKSNNKSILRINNKHNIMALFNAKMSKKGRESSGKMP